jgi:hypothetical protein
MCWKLFFHDHSTWPRRRGPSSRALPLVSPSSYSFPAACHWALEKDVGGGRGHGIDGGSWHQEISEVVHSMPRMSAAYSKIERAASQIWEKSSMYSLPSEMTLNGMMRASHLICLLPCPAECSAPTNRFKSVPPSLLTSFLWSVQLHHILMEVLLIGEHLCLWLELTWF